ncbi:hypothetical protein EUGRSUZ_J02069 [Eucalyptus grandis]|uniref:Uncharacterized protein n=2 Tax=Eucalyptus grandis TaxID=71139 RepID=A0ACC3J7K8_EUCGR|nr:hypothetical protein EUGRSUZ_J02069 [Eucalyptus grandis]
MALIFVHLLELATWSCSRDVLHFVEGNGRRSSACPTSSPSSVARACDPSGGIKVVGRGLESIGPGLQRLLSGPPVPSRELIHVVRAKARATCVLKWRAPREAGFTEQRKPPAPGSGRITGRC